MADTGIVYEGGVGSTTHQADLDAFTARFIPDEMKDPDAQPWTSTKVANQHHLTHMGGAVRDAIETEKTAKHTAIKASMSSAAEVPAADLRSANLPAVTSTNALVQGVAQCAWRMPSAATTHQVLAEMLYTSILLLHHLHRCLNVWNTFQLHDEIKKRTGWTLTKTNLVKNMVPFIVTMVMVGGKVNHDYAKRPLAKLQKYGNPVSGTCIPSFPLSNYLGRAHECQSLQRLEYIQRKNQEQWHLFVGVFKGIQFQL